MENLKIVLTTLNAKYSHSSLALRYLKYYCQPKYQIELKEFSINNQLLDILGQIFEVKPDVVGFACYIWNIEMTRNLVCLVKKVLPKVKIICGGPEVSYHAKEFLEENEMVDYVVQGEGEETFLTLLDHIEAGKNIMSIPAVTYFNDEKRIVDGRAVVVTDLNTIPFPYRDEDMLGLQDKIIYYESSRGCPFSCQYCLSSATKGVRFFDIERVLDELRFFIQHDVRQVKFVDRTFNAKKSHYVPILKFLTAQDCRTNFHFEIAVDLLDDEVLDLLERMPKGRVQLEIGVQSTHERTLETIQRQNKWDKIVYNVGRLLSFHNMHLHLDLIIGLPYEDYQIFQKSFNDVYALHPDMLQIGFLKMLKGSGITERQADHDYVFMNTAPYQVLANKYLSYEEVRKLHIFEDVFEQFYNTGRFKTVTSFFISLYNENAFAFYEGLTEYWQKQGYHLVAHTTKSLYQYLYEFAAAKFAGQAEVIKELLKFDALISDKGSIRADSLDWDNERYNKETSEFWREKTVGKYIENYKFTNWRALKKIYHIEVFKINMNKMKENHEIVIMDMPILFTYMDGKVSYQMIQDEDFWLGEN